MWALISNLFTALAGAFSLYKSIEKMVGKENTAKFLRDLDEATDLVVKSQDLQIPVDDRRRMRREALEKNRAIWGSIG